MGGVRSGKRWLLGGALFAALLAQGTPAEARFRFDQITPRTFDLGADDYFITAYSYRPRLLYRWLWDDGWRDAAVGYTITAGSLTTSDLGLDQRARVRIPFTDFLSGEYRYVQAEDYDTRYVRHEVEAVFRVLRPAYRAPLSATLGWTPRPDGLFFGGSGELAADKEFADIGAILGYRNDWFGVRLDAIDVDFVFNGKNELGGRYTSDPYTLKAQASARLLQGDLHLRLWFQDDLPLRLVLPNTDAGLVFRYRQLRAGADAAWTPADGVRLGLELRGELTGKHRRAGSPDPRSTQDLDRRALSLWLDAELDVLPLFGRRASRAADTWLLGLYVHLFDEDRRFPLVPTERETLRRGEAYLQVGYSLALPSPRDDVTFALRGNAYGGFLSLRDVRPNVGRHDLDRELQARVALGFEAAFRRDRAVIFVNLTYRLDQPEFGGGNVQVQMLF